MVEDLEAGDATPPTAEGIAGLVARLGQLAGTDAQKCCVFRGGPYTESRFFGEGVGIAVKKGNHTLQQALDYALVQLSQRGIYTDLYLKYFPIGFY